MKKTPIIITLLLLALHLFSQRLNNNQREKYNFNSDWELYLGNYKNINEIISNDQLFTKIHPGIKITLPRAFNEDEAFRLHIEQLTDTVMWYRKTFRLPATDQGKKVFIEFEGVRFGADVYLNGKHVALHENGVMAFGIDLTPYIHYNQENLIAVRVDNHWNYLERSTNSTWQWNNKNFNANYGGIPKNVFLHTTGPIYQTLPLYSNLSTTGTYVFATDFNIKNKSAIIHAESEVKNETDDEQEVSFRVSIRNPMNEEIADFAGDKSRILPHQTAILKAQHFVNNLHFWSWGYGYLYDVYTILSIDGKESDIVKTRTGFRKTEFKDGMIYLNDRVIQIKGYAQRSSNEWPGVGMSVPPHISDYSNRLMVESNANMVRWMHVAPWKQDVESCDRVGLMQMFPAGDAESDISGRRWEQRVELMRDAIIYNRNNPSIVLLEAGNKGINEEHMTEMKALRDKYDPYGGRAIGAREMLNSHVAEYGGEMLYINKSSHKPVVASEYCRDEALRKYWDEFTTPFHKDGAGPLYKNADASIYNRNQDSFAKEEIIRWYDYFICRPGTGQRVSSGGLNIIFSDTNTHCRGEENYRRSGETDAMRILKDAYYAHKVMWDGWVDIENFHTYIIGHWNYQTGTTKDLLVVSPSDKVELKINGRSLGYGRKSYHFLHTFSNVKYEPGVLKAISYTNSGKIQSEDIKYSTDKPTALKLSLVDSSNQIKADGADMALLQVEVVDKNGLRCPNVHPLVYFEIKGPADWRGGIGQGADNYILSKSLPAECGVNRALIRSTTTPGKICIKAHADGLTSDTLELETLAFETENGLSKQLPADGTTLNLSRGETPVSPSFKTSQKTVAIQHCITGCRQENSKFMFDDDETTEWSNNGEINSAFATFHFRHKENISGLSLKLSEWRSRSYPIEVWDEDKLVWQGDTPRSLGYIYIYFDKIRTRQITIRLTGSSTDHDAFGQMVELGGYKEKDLTKTSKNNKGTFGIVEVDFFEKIY
jgi:hypothetical protein